MKQEYAFVCPPTKGHADYVIVYEICHEQRDAFVFQRLHKAWGFAPSNSFKNDLAEDRWARRVYYNATGLPA